MPFTFAAAVSKPFKYRKCSEIGLQIEIQLFLSLAARFMYFPFSLPALLSPSELVCKMLVSSRREINLLF